MVYQGPNIVAKIKKELKELLINEDYRTTNNTNLERFLFPANTSSNFVFNKFFRKITKNKDKSSSTYQTHATQGCM